METQKKQGTKSTRRRFVKGAAALTTVAVGSSDALDTLAQQDGTIRVLASRFDAVSFERSFVKVPVLMNAEEPPYRDSHFFFINLTPNEIDFFRRVEAKVRQHVATAMGVDPPRLSILLVL
jgi:hypothetical protein